MFITAEYRRGLIRITLAASPRRGRVLAAKAIVIGAVTFVAGLAGAAVAVPLGERLLRANGNYVLPGRARSPRCGVVAGTAALLAVAAVLALALGAILRHGAGAVTVVIALIVAALLPRRPAGRPARRRRGLAAAGHPGRRASPIQQSVPAYPQVSTPTRRSTATSRSRRGPGSPCCAPGPRRPGAGRRSCCAGGTHEPRAARGVDQAAHRCPAPAGCCSAVVAVTVARQRRRPPPPRARPAACHVDTAKLSLTGIYLGQAVVAVAGRAGGQRRVRHRHDPHSPWPRCPAGPPCWPPRPPWSPAWCWPPATVAVLRLAAGRAADPARPRLHPGARLPGAVARATGRCCAPPPGRCSTWP